MAREGLRRAGHLVGEWLVIVQGRLVDVLDRKGAALDLDHRRAREEIREGRGVERRRGNDHLQLRSLREQAVQVAEDEVDVQRAFVGLVDDQRVVLPQPRITARLREQDAVGHELHDRAVARRTVLEADLVADLRAQLDPHFLRDPAGHRGCRDPARLRASDPPTLCPEPESEGDLRQLRRFPRARVPADDDDLVGRDGLRDLRALARDRERFWKGNHHSMPCFPYVSGGRRSPRPRVRRKPETCFRIACSWSS